MLLIMGQHLIPRDKMQPRRSRWMSQTIEPRSNPSNRPSCGEFQFFTEVEITFVTPWTAKNSVLKGMYFAESPIGRRFQRFGLKDKHG